LVEEGVGECVILILIKFIKFKQEGKHTFKLTKPGRKYGGIHKTFQRGLVGSP